MKLLSYFKNLRQQAGFTMIELLIVIAILGILAVAVLAAINPIEQINRGRDTGTRSDAEQLLSAIDRYYAFNGFYPWQTGAADTLNIDLEWTRFEDTALTDSGGDCTVAEKLGTAVNADCTGADEIKKSFIDRISADSYNYLYLSRADMESASTYVCFAPQSQAFVQEVATRLDPDGDGTETAPDDYPAEAIGGGDCGPSENCVCLP